MYTSGAGDLLFAFCSQLVAGDLPLEARPWFGGARLVAMLEDVDEDGRPIPTACGGGIRPIAMGEVLRKLVGKVVCK
jgi:putative intracellular protease/amidase